MSDIRREGGGYIILMSRSLIYTIDFKCGYELYIRRLTPRRHANDTFILRKHILYFRIIVN